MSTLAQTDERIAAFAAAVRAHLDDLPADDVDDLVDGLEADLTEQAGESDQFELPDAAAYAAELRSAAGLPERTAAPRKDPLRERLAERRAAASRSIRSNPFGAWLLDLGLVLRPMWWIARGWMVYFFFTFWAGAGIVPPTILHWALLLGLVLVSIQWGRDRWMPLSWLKVVRTIVSVGAAILLPIALIAASNMYGQVQSMVEYVDTSQPGLVVDGQRVRNIFAYDADGQPIEGVQLFDQDGRALMTVGDEGTTERWEFDYYFLGGGGPVPVPLSEAGRAPVWNVYPLAELSSDSTEAFDPADAVVPRHPFVQVPSVADERVDEETDAATADPTPTPTPSGR